MKTESEYKIRLSDSRGSANHGWLQAKHSFSFADYQDPEYDRFRTMRVLNEDRIAPRSGFPTHPHKDMEIVTYVLSGSLHHRDSMGNSAMILPGDAQRMSAGTGVIHSEMNTGDEETHLFQIWIFPDIKALEPGYEQKSVPDDLKRNRLCMIASKNPDAHAVKIHQDARIFVANVDPGRRVSYAPELNRHVWIQMASGEMKVNGNRLKSGDGMSASPASELAIEGISAATFLLFDLN